MFGQRGRLNARLIGLAVVFAVAGMALTARIVYVQLVHAGHYQNEARDEHFGQQVVRAPRGAILDRTGAPLANSARQGESPARAYPIAGAAAITGYHSLRYGSSGLEEDRKSVV